MGKSYIRTSTSFEHSYIPVYSQHTKILDLAEYNRVT
jgi:hypothetical protein